MLEADRAVAVPLGSWTEGGDASRAAVPMGAEVPADQLTGTVGGAATWSRRVRRGAEPFRVSTIRSATSRRSRRKAWIRTAARISSPAGGAIPRTTRSTPREATTALHELLDRLRWRLLYEWGDAQWAAQQDEAEAQLRHALGLTHGRSLVERAARGAPALARAPMANASSTFVPMDKTFVEQPKIAASSAFATEATQRFAAPAWQLRSSLLHGAIYGVPMRNAPAIDLRPTAAQLAVAIGEHDDDLLAALASPDGATVDQRRAAERLLAAFTAQKLDQIASPNGVVEIEEHEHASGFSALPGGSAGTDRFIQRVQTGGVGGLDLGRGTREAAIAQSALNTSGVLRDRAPLHARAMGARALGGISGTMIFSATAKPTLNVASAAQINDIARSRVGDVLAPTEARVVNRPAQRFSFPNDPMVAIRGVNRIAPPQQRRTWLGGWKAHVPLADARDHRDHRRRRAKTASLRRSATARFRRRS